MVDWAAAGPRPPRRLPRPARRSPLPAVENPPLPGRITGQKGRGVGAHGAELMIEIGGAEIGDWRLGIRQSPISNLLKG